MTPRDPETGEPLGPYTPPPPAPTGLDVEAVRGGARSWAEEAWDRGDVRAWLFRHGLTHFGARWGEWTPLATLDARVTAWMMRERDKAGLEGVVDDGELSARCAGSVVRYLRTLYVPHLSHVALGRPYHAWRQPGAVPLPLPEAERKIDEAKAVRRKGSDRTNGSRRQRAAQGKAAALQAWRIVSLEQNVAASVAAMIGQPRGTVKRWLWELKREGLLAHDP